MSQFAAYLLLKTGGNAAPTADDIKTLLGQAGIDADEERLAPVVSSSLGGASIQSLIVEIVASEAFRTRADEVSP